MASLTDRLSAYAAYHRDRRNVALHLVGIPLIVLAAEILLSRPALSFGALRLPLAAIAAAIATIYYIRLDVRLGLTMGILLAGATWIGMLVAAQPFPIWLCLGLGLFLVGWVIQFVGHHYEGRKPAFFDDVMGLIIGPLFVLAEAAFLLGLRHDLDRAIHARSGRTPE